MINRLALTVGIVAWNLLPVFPNTPLISQISPYMLIVRYSLLVPEDR